MICRCFVGKNLGHKISLFKKSEIILDEILDVGNIVHKLEEFDKLKMILLNKEQIALFNFIAKDIVSLNFSKMKANKINEMKEFTKDKENLAKIILEYMERVNLDKNSRFGEIDLKLLDMLHDEFKQNLME